MKQLTVGIMAHVDSGKTTLAEALLYHTGEIRKRGRVDHGDSWLDTDAIERSRGITIFAHQASFPLGERLVTLLDTPGHVDFSAETERTMQVLDCAVLVISGTDGVQSHTRTLWRLLQRYEIPVILFINKMDLSEKNETALMQELQAKLSPACVQFDTDDGTRCEAAATCSEQLMETYLDTGTIPPEMLRDAASRREIFPCCFGSARDMKGVPALLSVLDEYAAEKERLPEFGARVFKISVDAKGSRITFLKVLGGTLKNRAELTYQNAAGEMLTEKITGIRFYSGAKYIAADEAETGAVCAVTGLSDAYAGLGLGAAVHAASAQLTPVMRYQVLLPPEIPPVTALSQFKQLEAEDPQLHVLWNEQLRAMYVQLMGKVQLEVLTRQIEDRFGYAVSFDSGSVTYKETITDTVEGVGHYEPLKHYAEVHLILTPLPAGSGLQFETHCSEDALDRNWQRLILTHLEEKEHLGVLTGSPVTDMKLTLVSGKAHAKHTEGGDFRQATYRAVRQGLRSAQSVLLEPYYDFTLDLPAEALGRAMTDLPQRAADFSPPDSDGVRAVISGSAPVSELNDYAAEIMSYTKGQGELTLSFGGYRPCHNADDVIERIGYNPDSDLENSADSVFCAHGAGFLVNWAEVPQYMHLPSALRTHSTEFEEEAVPVRRLQFSAAGDDELMAIYERTYGKVGGDSRKAMRRDPKTELDPSEPVSVPMPKGKEYLLVDGYNIIFSWESLKKLAAENLESARSRLIHLLSNYQGFRKCEVILVFDAYKIKGHATEIVQEHNISVVYTKEAETADSYIERVTHQLAKDHRVRVATSDGLEQIIILEGGAVRISAREFEAEMRQTEAEIRALIGGTG